MPPAAARSSGCWLGRPAAVQAPRAVQWPAKRSRLHVMVLIEMPSDAAGLQSEVDQSGAPRGIPMMQRASGLKVQELLARIRARAARPDLTSLSLLGGARLWPADLVEHVLVSGETGVAAPPEPTRSGRA